MDYNLPSHISIIMDGNRRWAKKRLLPKVAGHRAGAKALENLVNDANEIGLKYLSVYAFSTENWNREQEEVNSLMSLLREYIDDYLKNTKKNNVILKVIGNKKNLETDLQQKINKIEKETKNNTGLTLVIAISYGGRDEIIRATKKLIIQAIKAGIDIESIDESHFERYLDTYGIPSPELLIRTSGEMRLSNFLLWQIPYTEMYFTDTLWPDFTINDLLIAVSEFNKRVRHFGG